MTDLLIQRDSNLRAEILSGLTVALALVPEAVGFAFVAGVDPSVGLWAAFFVGLITSALGGRPGMISGATGAMAVVMTAFVVLYGLEYLFAAVILCGVIQIACGLLGVGKFIRLLPHPVMLGFVNGLAIVIGLAQLEQLKTNHHLSFNSHSQALEVVGQWVSGTELATTVGLILATMAIINWLPKFTKLVPGTLAAIIAVTIVVQFTPLQAVTVSDTVAQMNVLTTEKGVKTRLFEAEKPDLRFRQIDDRGQQIAAADLASLPTLSAEPATARSAGRFAIPTIPLTFETLVIVGGLAMTLASIGLIESLMTLTLIDELTDTRGSSNRECVAQGLANMVAGLFGSMGGCAMIGQSMINIRSGGRGRLSGVVAALSLLAFIVFPPLWNCIGLIPVPALVGVMFIVVIATFEWTSLRLWNKIPRSDMFVIVAVSAITVFFDLAIAVASGVIISALVFAWQKSHTMQASVSENDGIKCYEIEGPLFFGAVTAFKELFSPQTDPNTVRIRFTGSRVHDHSALEAINGICAKYRALGKEVTLTGLSDECLDLLGRADRILDVRLEEADPQVAV
ncbi:SulP family inorganic anion transporter [Botrimarina hoheduenensis]|uniref:Bicarbonate transporter BicA n=1 Tax=Botrimarina hoheduenensis TaxID=2528000 RepID=A0A5C5WEB4_9BACT|nr:SulP family inorganic anion transporter [Botrimarina hoheduenensis]TWT48817.1 Bicarbonate transporter BicA [Botrimarina hoheduenensis]